MQPSAFIQAWCYCTKKIFIVHDTMKKNNLDFLRSQLDKSEMWRFDWHPHFYFHSSDVKLMQMHISIKKGSRFLKSWSNRYKKMLIFFLIEIFKSSTTGSVHLPHQTFSKARVYLQSNIPDIWKSCLGSKWNCCQNLSIELVS